MIESYFERYIVAGGIMMFLLLPLSVITLGLILQCFISLRKSRVAPKSLIDAAKAVSCGEEYRSYLDSLRNNGSGLAEASRMTLDAVEKNPSWRLEENPGLVEAAADRLYHKLTPLSVIYTIAPLMGLLGTILGMSDTFFEFAQMGQNREISQLSTGINQALITTMWGLMIAIPAYVFSSVLRHKVFAYEKDILPSRLAEILNACRQYAGSGQAGDPVGFDPGARKPAAPSSPDAASAKGA